MGRQYTSLARLTHLQPSPSANLSPQIAAVLSSHCFLICQFSTELVQTEEVCVYMYMCTGISCITSLSSIATHHQAEQKPQKLTPILSPQAGGCPSPSIPQIPLQSLCIQTWPSSLSQTHIFTHLDPANPHPTSLASCLPMNLVLLPSMPATSI